MKTESILTDKQTDKIIKSMLDTVVMGISILNPKMQIVWLNKTFRKQFPDIDVQKKPLCYKSFYSPPKKNICDYCPSIKAFKTGKTHSSETDICADGKIYNIIATPVKNKKGKVSYVVETVEDISERKKAQEDLKKSEEEFRLIFENAKDAIFWADPKTGFIIKCNKAAEILLEKKREEIVGFHQTTFHPPQKARYYTNMFKKHIKQRGVADDEAEIITKSGEIKPVHITASVTLVGEQLIIQGIFRDISERKQAKQNLEKLNRELLKSNEILRKVSLIDSQTNLYNHHYLSEAMEREFHRAQRYAHPLSVIMLDIDYFKSINDVYGHQFGDLVLRQFANQLKRMVRKYDIVIRFGGEEFVVVSPGTGRNTALNLAQRLSDAINLHNFGSKKHTIKLKLSVAVTSYPEDKAVKGINLIDFADKILNKVKEDGGDRVYSTLDMEKKKLLSYEKIEERTDIRLLREKMDKLTKRANQSLVEAIYAFAKTIKLKDHYTGEHVEKTVQYAIDTAKALGLSKKEIEHIKQAAILHDLGKIGIRERILLKKTKLTKKESEEIKKHPQIAADIMRPIHFLHDIIPLVVYHHERWDGKGYGSALKGEEIPVGARIIAIADVYQALISNRPYRKAYSKDKAIKIIEEGSGVQFDPKIVHAFLKILEKENKS